MLSSGAMARCGGTLAVGAMAMALVSVFIEQAPPAVGLAGLLIEVVAIVVLVLAPFATRAKRSDASDEPFPAALLVCLAIIFGGAILWFVVQ